jgi:hypothetical protein
MRSTARRLEFNADEVISKETVEVHYIKKKIPYGVDENPTPGDLVEI